MDSVSDRAVAEAAYRSVRGQLPAGVQPGGVNLQAIFKHKGAIRKHLAMGLFALPNILIFQILLPLVSPLIDLMFVAGVIHYFIDKHFHPESASADSFHKLLIFFAAIILIPVYVLVVTSFKGVLETDASHAWSLPHLWTTEAWSQAWDQLSPNLANSFKLVFPDGRWSVDEKQLVSRPTRGDVVVFEGSGGWRIEGAQRVSAHPAGKAAREFFVCAPVAA